MVMQYAVNDNLFSYLNQNINELTWTRKLGHLCDIAYCLHGMHNAGLVYCYIHGENIAIYDNTAMIGSNICNLGRSKSVNSCKSGPNIQGDITFIAPEVFHTREFTQKSDVYSFGIIMYLIATGEQPFSDRQLDSDLLCDIMGGLRPSMPDSAPEKYKKLAEQCCDSEPDKRPNACMLFDECEELFYANGGQFR